MKGLLRVPEAQLFIFLGIEFEDVCAALSAVLYHPLTTAARESGKVWDGVGLEPRRR